MPSMDMPERVNLGFFPTPLQPLRHLSSDLGVELWIKRDDQTGLAFGGNKTRKLEFLMAEAVAAGCDCVVTAGAKQSNHCRQTAAAASALNLACHLVLGGEASGVPEGNLLLDTLLGAKIHWSGELRKGEKIPELVHELSASGHRPFVVPYGGSNATGAMGFVQAMVELTEQESTLDRQFDTIVFASSSGGTHAGLMVGQKLTGSRATILGIRIDKDDGLGASFPDYILHLANETSSRVGNLHRFTNDELHLCDQYTGSGYGCVGPLEKNAIRELAQKEGILLDPVYTGRAFGALLDLIREGKLNSSRRILFWHTGGATALFPYAADLTEKDSPNVSSH